MLRFMGRSGRARLKRKKGPSSFIQLGLERLERRDVFSGGEVIWVDEATREVVRAEATAIDSVSFGAGFVARLNEGATVSLTRERVDDGVWLPTAIRMKGNGRALLLRRMNIDYAIEWFDYRIPNTRKPQPPSDTR